MNEITPSQREIVLEGERYLAENMVTADGRNVYRHAEGEVRFVPAFLDDAWTLVPLSDGEALFDLEEWHRERETLPYEDL